MTSVAVVTALERGGRGGVFYLHGQDEFRKNEAAGLIVDGHLDPATSDFNYDRLRGSELDLEQLASTLATPPLMAEWRVVLLQEIEALATNSRARGLILGIAESPPPGLALILVCTVPDGSRARFYKDLSTTCRSMEFAALSPDDVPGWVIDRGRNVHGVEVDADAARALSAAAGPDLGVLGVEIDKLAGLVGEGGTITADVVESAGIRLPKQDRWGWFDLVGQRRFEEAATSLPILFDQGENGVGLVIGLATHLLRLGVIAVEGIGGLEAVLPGHQRWMVRRHGRSLQAQARRWSVDGLERALEELRRVDRLLKSSGLSQEALLEEWLLTRIVRGGQEAA
jgi:DNA polymerase-3 subunit delta